MQCRWKEPNRCCVLSILNPCSIAFRATRGANGVPDEVPVPKEWRRLPLRGCGTDVGGEWEAAGRRAASIPMPDVRLLNRLVQYLGTSKHALELKSERQKKSAAKVQWFSPKC